MSEHPPLDYLPCAICRFSVLLYVYVRLGHGEGSHRHPSKFTLPTRGRKDVQFITTYY